MQQPCCIYDVAASWEENLRRGPRWTGAVPERVLPPAEDWVDFLGFKVASRLGVPAGPLLDSRWTTLAGQLGFDVVTYKTIRTQPSQGHGPPNVLYLEAHEQLSAADDGTPLKSCGQELRAAGQPADGNAAPAAAAAAAAGPAAAGALAAAALAPPPPAVAITNSFGMPSMDRRCLLQDIPAAAAALSDGQLLVVSVTGTPNRPDGVGFFDDFVEAALLAKQAGARVIEANLSCPNVGRGQGALYTDPEQVAAVSSALVRALGPELPLLIKVGAFADGQLLERVLVAAAGAGVRGVAGINGLSRTIVDAAGAPALGPERPTSGVCGAPIRAAALAFVRAARAAIDARGLGLALVGVGGVSTAAHAREMLEAGADLVQAATGMMWNPLLAQQYHALCRQEQQQGQQQQQDGQGQQQQEQQRQQGSAAEQVQQPAACCAAQAAASSGQVAAAAVPAK